MAGAVAYPVGSIAWVMMDRFGVAIAALATFFTIVVALRVLYAIYKRFPESPEGGPVDGLEEAALLGRLDHLHAIDDA